MVKKFPIRKWIKPVIGSLREGNKTWNELMQIRIKLTENKNVQISIHTLDRILKDYLQYWGLAQKEGDYWVWYEHRRVFSGLELEHAIDHSKQLFVSLLGPPGTFKVDPYDMLDFLVFSDTVESESGIQINQDLSCFREHIRSGYPGINVKMMEYRKRIEKIGGVLRREEIVCEPNGEKSCGPMIDSVEPLPKDCEELKSCLTWEILRLNHFVQHGNPLEGTCVCCPSRNVTIKE